VHLNQFLQILHFSSESNEVVVTVQLPDAICEGVADSEGVVQASTMQTTPTDRGIVV